jgi:hypothetical protein
MAAPDPDTRLHQLHLAAERISNNLIELEIDPSRQLLDASRLEGRSAERWSAASAALTELWRRLGLLEALLARADGLRSRDELRSLVEGQSIELSDGLRPLAERELLDTARIAERCSAEELLTWMATAFDEVKEIVTRFAATWDALGPRLEAARARLAEARQLAAELGEPADDDLAWVADTLQRLTARLATDPLSMKVEEVEGAAREVLTRRESIQAGADLKRESEARLAAAREQLKRLRSLEAEVQAAHAELTRKVVLLSTPPAPALPEGLDMELARITELTRDRNWREASRALRAWSETADSLLGRLGQALDVNRAPIQARNQFRALTEAYKIKAQRLGLLEDPELEHLFDRLDELLYNAPTDLALATQCMRSCQITLSRAEAPREVRQ